MVFLTLLLETVEYDGAKYHQAPDHLLDVGGNAQEDHTVRENADEKDT